jgi:hypothetical protein
MDTEFHSGILPDEDEPERLIHAPETIYFLGWGKSFEHPELNGTHTDVSVLSNNEERVKQKSKTIHLPPNIENLSHEELSKHPEVVSKVISDGTKIIMYKGVAQQIFDIIGTMALDGMISIKNVGDKKIDHLFFPFSIVTLMKVDGKVVFEKEVYQELRDAKVKFSSILEENHEHAMILMLDMTLRYIVKHKLT